MNATRPVWAGARDMLPFSLGIFAYGIVYGVLARAAGLTLGETVSMSALVFAGAS